MKKDNIFRYGTNYWRPPNPPRDQHRFHLDKIKNELGFDIVNLRLMWNWHNREQDKYGFDEVHEMCDICAEVGLDVMLQLNLETAPYWLEEMFPESRYVTANGHAVELGSQEAVPTGGHPGLCFHHEGVMKYAEKYARRMTREFKDRPNLYAIDAWNEPHLEPVWCCNMWGNTGDKVYCYCDGSREAFRRWLQDRYGDIQTFNDTWGRAYTRFDQVQPPVLQGNYADWIDWMRFWHGELAGNMQWRVKALKEEAAHVKVVSHSGAVPPVLPRANAMIHNWKFADAVEMWGTSFAPQAFSWDLATCAQVIELTRSAARGKGFWISEMPGGPSNIRGFRSSRIPRGKDYHTWNWLAAVLGSSGTLHWCYLSERTGQESPGFGMMRLNGKHTKRSLAIAETAARLKKYGDIILADDAPTQVAVLYDPDNSSLLFAMELADKLYGQSHTGYYRAIWKSDLTARYVTYDTLADIREKVLIVPMALTMPEPVADAIAKFVHDGGVLIADGMTGLYDERGWLRANLPAGKLSEAAGLSEGEMVCSDPDNDIAVPAADGSIDSTNRTDLPEMDPIHKGPPITFDWPVAAQVPVHGYLAPLEPNGARAIGKYEDMVLATHNEYGKGQVYYFGTYMGLALDKNLPDAHLLLKTILQKHATSVVSGKRLRPRLIGRGDKAMLVVFNDHRTETITEAVTLSDKFTQARDVVQDKQLEVSGQSVTVTVEAENAVVLLLS